MFTVHTVQSDFLFVVKCLGFVFQCVCASDVGGLLFIEKFTWLCYDHCSVCLYGL